MKIALWTGGVLLALLLLLAFAAMAGFWWAENRYLQRDIRFGEKSKGGEHVVRVHGAELDWRLRVSADSVWYRGPDAEARLGATAAAIDWVGGLRALNPAVRLDANNLHVRWIRVEPAADDASPFAEDTTARKPPAFPDFEIPLGADLRVGEFTVEDDSGNMLSARNVRARSPGGKRARLDAEGVVTRWNAGLPVDAGMGLGWHRDDSVTVRAEITRGDDRIRLFARHAMSDLLNGRDSVSAEIADADPYLAALGMDSGALPQVTDFRLDGSARPGEIPEARVRLRADTKAYRAHPDFALGPQETEVSAEWRGDRGTLRVQSRGREGEDIRAEADVRLLEPPADRDSVPAWERVAASLQGHARNLRVNVRDTLRTTDAVIERAEWDGRELAVRLVTGDSSHVEAEGRPDEETGEWRATFALNVNPDERWLRVFAGESIAFETLQARGQMHGAIVTADVAAGGVVAYGVAVDSLQSSHVYGPDGYELKSSRLHARGIVWDGSGKVEFPEEENAGIFLSFELKNPDQGSVRYTQHPNGSMEVTAADFNPAGIPYEALDTLPVENLVVSGSFFWDKANRSGQTDVTAGGELDGERLNARVSARWDADRLVIDPASLRLRESVAEIRMAARLEGREFYEVASLGPNLYDSVAVYIPHLDLAEILALALPESPLASGTVEGQFAWSGPTGFNGILDFSDLAQRDPVGDVSLKELRLEGLGDTLSVRGNTASESFPLLNTNFELALSGALADSQSVRAEVAGDSVRMVLQGIMEGFRSLRGTFEAAGRGDLPDGSGAIEDFEAEMEFDLAFGEEGVGGSLRTRTFGGLYVLPGLPTQRFSLDPSLRDGVIRVENLRIENDEGQSLDGTLEYVIASGVLDTRVAGARFVAQWGDDARADLRNPDLRFHMDSTGVRLEGSVAEGIFRYADPPLRAEGRVTTLRFDYSSTPLGADASAANGTDTNARPAGGTSITPASRGTAGSLNLSANLSESLVRYRLRSLSDVQRLFRDDRRQRPAAEGRNLRMNIRVQTLGRLNRIDSDFLRLTWTGDLEVRGDGPFTLLNGRVNALEGSFGLERQAYSIREMELVWLNAPAEEGRIAVEGRKTLAATCRPQQAGATDSCTVITRLDGELRDMQFSYDSDCGGAFGAGASVAALLYSVQRGCYDPSLSTGEARYGEVALSLLEPTASRFFSERADRYTGGWIESVEITGLGSLSREEQPGDTLGEALSLSLTSREYQRLRLKIRSGYHVESQDLSNPYEHMLALEWRPPVENLALSEAWRTRLRDNLRAVASIQTRPRRPNSAGESEVERKVGLNYAHFFWGSWWNKTRRGTEDGSGETGEASDE